MEQQPTAVTHQPADSVEERETRNDVLLPLDAPERLVRFTPQGWPRLSFIFRRITCDAWRKYFAGGVVERAQPQQAEQVARVDFNTPAVELVDRELLRVEGYTVAGGGEFMKLANWRGKIPMGHKIAAANLLDSARVSQAEGAMQIMPELEVVEIDAAWGTPAGGMMQFSRLVHRFTTPTVEHQRRYLRYVSESRVIGSGRTGKTIYANRNLFFLDLYDELIVEVGGYAVEGLPLVAEQSRIAEFMDGVHKVIAVGQLFEQPVVEKEQAA